jgi:hypothetical protein
MAHEDDVIDQADALMRRHRSFVARSAEPDTDAALPAEEVADDVDIPVLTEVVAADMAGPQTLDAMLDGLRDDLSDELSAWLVEVLPAAVANASQQILAELDIKARNTLLPRLQEIIEARRDRAAKDQSL